MKKVFFVLLFALFSVNAYAGIISVDAFISPDSVTIPHLETFRSTVLDVVNGNLDSNNIKADSLQESNFADAINPRVRWGEAFNDFVYSGLTIPTSDTLVGTTASGVAYIDGYRVAKDATQNTYADSKWTFVDLSYTGTYTYQNTSVGVAEPAVTSNAIRIARVSTDSTAITNVRDDRVLSVAVSSNDDHYRDGLFVSFASLATLTVSPGVVYHGTTRLTKASTNTLDLATASDWVSGVSGRATSKYGFVVIDSSGNLKLCSESTATPAYVDTEGNTDGIKRYIKISSTYYRVLGWFYMNATGSGNLSDWEIGNFKDGNVYNTVVTSDSNLSSQITINDTNYGTDFDETTVHFYSSGNPIEIKGVAGVRQHTSGVYNYFAIDVDGTQKLASEVGVYPAGDATTKQGATPIWVEDLAVGNHTIKMVGKVNANDIYVDNWVLAVEEK